MSDFILLKTCSRAVPGDLLMVRSIDEFVKHMKLVARESLRVLKPYGFCAS